MEKVRFERARNLGDTEDRQAHRHIQKEIPRYCISGREDIKLEQRA